MKLIGNIIKIHISKFQTTIKDKNNVSQHYYFNVYLSLTFVLNMLALCSRNGFIWKHILSWTWIDGDFCTSWVSICRLCLGSEAVYPPFLVRINLESEASLSSRCLETNQHEIDVQDDLIVTICFFAFHNVLLGTCSGVQTFVWNQNSLCT